MRRVVVTGMGIVSAIGNNTQEVLASLREAKSGISFAPDQAKLGFRCQVHGAPTLDPAGSVDRRAMRFLGGGAAWNHVAMERYDLHNDSHQHPPNNCTLTSSPLNSPSTPRGIITRPSLLTRGERSPEGPRTGSAHRVAPSRRRRTRT